MNQHTFDITDIFCNLKRRTKLSKINTNNYYVKEKLQQTYIQDILEMFVLYRIFKQIMTNPALLIHFHFHKGGIP